VKVGWRIAAGVAAAALLVAGIAIYLVQANAARARFLMAPPDSIAGNPALIDYAMARGRPAYAQHCASCHGAQLQGDTATGTPNLTDSEWLYGTGRIGEIERVILYGIRAGYSKGWDLASMPAFGKPVPYKRYKIPSLTPTELNDLTAFVLALRRQPVDADAAGRGSKIFHSGDRGVCWDCHGEDAKGDTAIGAPDLTDAIWLYGDGSRQSIYESIAYGRAGTCPAWIARLPPETIRALAVYVHFASRKTAGQPATAGKTHD
jgi:cytochrome c oxidase cbb3-type subunit III